MVGVTGLMELRILRPRWMKFRSFIMKQILKVLVGSRAHGLNRADSDYDYRGVFLTPTEEHLKLKSIETKPKGVHWVEGEREDDTSYELGHFLHLATKSNPSILEVFVAPIVGGTALGHDLRALFPYVWSSRRVLEAFVGYSRNQQKKMFDDKYESRDRKWKYAVAYIRVLLQAQQLIRTGTMSVVVPAEWKQPLIDIKNGEWSIGHVVDVANQLKVGVYDAYERCQEDDSENFANLDKLDEFLLKVRKENW